MLLSSSSRLSPLLVSKSSDLTQNFGNPQIQDVGLWGRERVKKAAGEDPRVLDGHAMADWRAYQIADHIQNAGGFSLSRSAENTVWVPGRRNHNARLAFTSHTLELANRRR